MLDIEKIYPIYKLWYSYSFTCFFNYVTKHLYQIKKNVWYKNIFFFANQIWKLFIFKNYL